VIIRRSTCGQKDASHRPAASYHQARGEASITGPAPTPLRGAHLKRLRLRLPRSAPVADDPHWRWRLSDRLTSPTGLTGRRHCWPGGPNSTAKPSRGCR